MEHNVLTANSQMAKIDEMRASMTPHERDTFNEALIAEARALIEKGDRMMEAESEHIRPVSYTHLTLPTKRIV